MDSSGLDPKQAQLKKKFSRIFWILRSACGISYAGVLYLTPSRGTHLLAFLLEALVVVTYRHFQEQWIQFGRALHPEEMRWKDEIEKIAQLTRNEIPKISVVISAPCSQYQIAYKPGRLNFPGKLLIPVKVLQEFTDSEIRWAIASALASGQALQQRITTTVGLHPFIRRTKSSSQFWS